MGSFVLCPYLTHLLLLAKLVQGKERSHHIKRTLLLRTDDGKEKKRHHPVQPLALGLFLVILPSFLDPKPGTVDRTADSEKRRSRCPHVLCGSSLYVSALALVLALALAASFAEEGGGGASLREAPGSSPGPEAAADAAWSGDAPRFSLIIDLNWIIHELRCVSSGSL